MSRISLNTSSDDANVSATKPDWSRETVQCFWDPGRKLLRAIRRYQALKARGGLFARMAAKYWVLNHGFWSLVTQSEIHLSTNIGGGLRGTFGPGLFGDSDLTVLLFDAQFLFLGDLTGLNLKIAGDLGSANGAITRNFGLTDGFLFGDAGGVRLSLAISALAGDFGVLRGFQGFDAFVGKMRMYFALVLR